MNRILRGIPRGKDRLKYDTFQTGYQIWIEGIVQNKMKTAEYAESQRDLLREEGLNVCSFLCALRSLR